MTQKSSRNTFIIRATACDTCIYKPGLGWDIARLEEQIADGFGGFNGFRACHHHPDNAQRCCRGFWNKHKDHFALGQVAQRLGFVDFSDEGSET